MWRGICEYNSISGSGIARAARKRASNSLKLGTVGQVAVEQQKRRLFVRHMPGQILDPVTPVLESARAILPLDIGDCRLACNHAFQARRITIRRGTTHVGTPHSEDESV